MSNNMGARLRAAKESLSIWYDRLNSQWADAEKTLCSLNLSEDVWASFETETIESEHKGEIVYVHNVDHCLAFLKKNGKWGIHYGVGELGDPDSYQSKPILECSLQERQFALKGLPRLLEKIVIAAEEKAVELESALGAAAESLSTFKAIAE